MTTCNQLDLQTLGSQLTMPEHLPHHWLASYRSNGWVWESNLFKFKILGKLLLVILEETYGNTPQIHWSGRFLGIIGWDPSVCKSNRLHTDIIRFSLIKLGYLLLIPLKWSVIILQSWTSTGYISNSTGSSVTNCRFSPIIAQISEEKLNHRSM
jgi:hypothetical protein